MSEFNVTQLWWYRAMQLRSRENLDGCSKVVRLCESPSVPDHMSTHCGTDVPLLNCH